MLVTITIAILGIIAWSLLSGLLWYGVELLLDEDDEF